MFNVIPDKLPEKYASTICCDVCTDDPNKSFHVLNPVSEEILYAAFAYQFGLDNLLYCFSCMNGTIVIRSKYAGFCSSTTQHLKSTSYSAGNGSYSLTYKYSPTTTLLTNNAV